MSCDVEKGIPESTESDHLLENREENRVTCCSVSQEQQSSQRHPPPPPHHHHHHHHHHHRRQARHQQLDPAKNLPSYEKSNRSDAIGIVDGSSHAVGSATTTLPSIVVSDVDENDEDPPPYSAIAPPDHVGWPFVFSTPIPYSVHATQPCITEPPLAPFQTPPPALTLASALPLPLPSLQASSLQASSLQPPGTTYRVETPSLDRPIPSLSLTPYRFFKFGSHRSIFGHRSSIFTDNASAGKEVRGGSRRYGAILVAAAVIVFLMALSLMVRFVMERSFWRR